MSHEDKFKVLERRTLLEQDFVRLKEQEDRDRIAEQENRERERMEQFRQKAQRNIFQKKYHEYLSPVDDERGLRSGLSRTSSQRSMESERIGLRRTESMTTGSRGQVIRRTSFGTRRKTTNITTVPERNREPPPSDIEGFLDRKHQLQVGGKRAPVRSWKQYYTVLCGHVLAFFKDQQALNDKSTATAPIMLVNARVEKASDYTKRKHVFRLTLNDGTQFLFGAQNEDKLDEWVKKIEFHASLHPSQQLTQYPKGFRNPLETTFEHVSGSERSTPTNFDSKLNSSMGSVSPTPTIPESVDGNGSPGSVQEKIQMFQQHSDTDIINKPVFTNLSKEPVYGNVGMGYDTDRNSNLSRTASLPPGAAPGYSYNSGFSTMRPERSDSIVSSDAQSVSSASHKDSKKRGMFSGLFRKNSSHISHNSSNNNNSSSSNNHQ